MPNITTRDLGTFYVDKEGTIWKLINFKPEPQVEMYNVKIDSVKSGNLSEFKDFVRLIPEKRKYTRKEKPVEQASTPSAAPPKKRTKKALTLADLKITVGVGDSPHSFKLGERQFECALLFDCALWAVKELKLTDSTDLAEIIKALKEQPESQTRNELLAIFEVMEVNDDGGKDKGSKDTGNTGGKTHTGGTGRQSIR